MSASVGRCLAIRAAGGGTESDLDVPQSFDPAAEHRWYCPWVYSPLGQVPSSTVAALLCTLHTAVASYMPCTRVTAGPGCGGQMEEAGRRLHRGSRQGHLHAHAGRRGSGRRRAARSRDCGGRAGGRRTECSCPRGGHRESDGQNVPTLQGMRPVRGANPGTDGLAGLAGWRVNGLFIALGA